VAGAQGCVPACSRGADNCCVCPAVVAERPHQHLAPSPSTTNKHSSSPSLSVVLDCTLESMVRPVDYYIWNAAGLRMQDHAACAAEAAQPVLLDSKALWAVKTAMHGPQHCRCVPGTQPAVHILLKDLLAAPVFAGVLPGHDAVSEPGTRLA